MLPKWMPGISGELCSPTNAGFFVCSDKILAMYLHVWFSYMMCSVFNLTRFLLFHDIKDLFLHPFSFLLTLSVRVSACSFHWSEPGATSWNPNISVSLWPLALLVFGHLTGGWFGKLARVVVSKQHGTKLQLRLMEQDSQKMNKIEWFVQFVCVFKPFQVEAGQSFAAWGGFVVPIEPRHLPITVGSISFVPVDSTQATVFAKMRETHSDRMCVGNMTIPKKHYVNYNA